MYMGYPGRIIPCNTEKSRIYMGTETRRKSASMAVKEKSLGVKLAPDLRGTSV
jgi:hypothetical protein